MSDALVEVQHARAVVCAAGVDTEYVRAGQGETMVLVAAPLASPEVQRDIAWLAKHYLVLAAAPPANGGLRDWLAGFLEGLGFSDAHVMLHASVAADTFLY